MVEFDCDDVVSHREHVRRAHATNTALGVKILLLFGLPIHKDYTLTGHMAVRDTSYNVLGVVLVQILILSNFKQLNCVCFLNIGRLLWVAKGRRSTKTLFVETAR